MRVPAILQGKLAPYHLNMPFWTPLKWTFRPNHPSWSHANILEVGEGAKGKCNPMSNSSWWFCDMHKAIYFWVGVGFCLIRSKHFKRHSLPPDFSHPLSLFSIHLQKSPRRRQFNTMRKTPSPPTMYTSNLCNCISFIHNMLFLHL